MAGGQITGKLPHISRETTSSDPRPDKQPAYRPHGHKTVWKSRIGESRAEKREEKKMQERKENPKREKGERGREMRSCILAPVCV